MKTKLTTILSLILALVIGVGTTLPMTGCAVTVKAEELSADYTRTATDEGEVTDAFITAMADFSMTLFNTTVSADKETGKENHLVSPLSAMICLAMIANGAEGETLTQMETALGMDIQALNKALYAYTQSLYTDEDCKVSIADSIWYRDQDGLKVKEEFLQACADWYQAQQYKVPFDEETRKDINNWVNKYTDGMIDKILDEPIAADVMMYVINALVFDAKWLEKYEKSDVTDRDFTSLDGTKVQLPTLHSEESVYLSLKNGCGFAKKYKGGAYSFVGLLPDEDVDVYAFAAALDGAAWTSMWKSKTTETVMVRFPEFTYDSDMDLTPILQSMGMTNLFKSGAADLTGLGTYDGGNLYCSGVYQKTFIEVSRNGTKAAAVTWGAVCGNSASAEPKYVYLDRPFLYAIVDNATGLPLFVGIVTSL
ncbi:MAG: serine protease [Ruminococcaceae bacterium]|nr:serine protease [Oscillospiraceae bacterium]